MSGVASVVDRGHVRFVLPSSIEQASAGLQTSLSNYVAALYVTNLLDLGMWNSSPLLNREFFNRTFQANGELHGHIAALDLMALSDCRRSLRRSRSAFVSSAGSLGELGASACLEHLQPYPLGGLFLS